MNPSTPESSEPITMPSLAWLSISTISGEPNDRVAMNNETVKPMPPSIAIEAIIDQLVRAGIGASLSLTVIQEKINMPRNLPNTRPQIMAREIP